jgi:hypothetical protein
MNVINGVIYHGLGENYRFDSGLQIIGTKKYNAAYFTKARDYGLMPARPEGSHCKSIIAKPL